MRPPAPRPSGARRPHVAQGNAERGESDEARVGSFPWRRRAQVGGASKSRTSLPAGKTQNQVSTTQSRRRSAEASCAHALSVGVLKASGPHASATFLLCDMPNSVAFPAKT